VRATLRLPTQPISQALSGTLSWAKYAPQGYFQIPTVNFRSDC
jgi:hypothetical protein